MTFATVGNSAINGNPAIDGNSAIDVNPAIIAATWLITRFNCPSHPQKFLQALDKEMGVSY